MSIDIDGFSKALVPVFWWTSYAAQGIFLALWSVFNIIIYELIKWDGR